MSYLNFEQIYLLRYITKEEYHVGKDFRNTKPSTSISNFT
ncbi:hypothetical protein ACUXJ9_001692 [Staphylococcus caledonicus]